MPPRRTHALAAFALAGAALVTACASAPPATPQAARATATQAAPAPAPAAQAGAARVVLKNPGFESQARGPRGDPEGWFSFQHAGDLSYRFALDTDNPHSGTVSLRIEQVGPEPFGAIAQIVDARPHGGKKARVTAWLRTRDVSEDGAGLTVLVQRSGATIAQDFMYDAPVKGTTGWKRYTVAVPIEPGSTRLEVGAMLRGKGTLWLDDVELEILPN